jgi:hypothetical protein
VHRFKFDNRPILFIFSLFSLYLYRTVSGLYKFAMSYLRSYNGDNTRGRGFLLKVYYYIRFRSVVIVPRARWKKYIIIAQLFVTLSRRSVFFLMSPGRHALLFVTIIHCTDTVGRTNKRRRLTLALELRIYNGIIRQMKENILFITIHLGTIFKSSFKIYFK